MKYSIEILHHFTCDKCQLWWSISMVSELFVNKKAWYCPWCGHEHLAPHENITRHPHQEAHNNLERVSEDDPSIPEEIRQRFKDES
jgi:hypothetical protein